MHSTYRNLPLGALVGFEAAARLESFSLAAIELNMTQSAVSHQIKALENQLGQLLFHRINRKVELTDAGRDLRGTAASALETLRLGIRRLDFYTKPGSIVIMMPYAFATGWYMPRVASLVHDLPNIEPWLVTSDSEPDVTHSEIDFAIARGRGSWDGLVAIRLFGDELRPMCSPELRRRLPDTVTPRTLQDFPLLHHEEEEDWQNWFVAAGVIRPGFVKGLNFSDSGMVLDAAARGLGICLGSMRLAAERLKNGDLVTLGNGVPSSRSYYLLAHPRNLKRPGVTELWDWFITQADAPDL
ncbi:LysR substrate-binding domain-containing protein [Phyllobacterium sp. TAF24]|uniref:LysR substrate-binding domain-containing protein n=1 Tax=Phyllobacterium sp. TAF24 TaxID=3233068 RepID=UPI003F9B1EFE